MNEQAFSLIMGLLIGDAVGYPLGSLGKGHIRSTLGSVSGLTDPAEALKGHIERWKKPGLLSASGQLSLCAAAASRGRELSSAQLSTAIGSSGEGGISGTGPFRTPSRALRAYISNAYGAQIIAAPAVSAAMLPVCAAASIAVSVNRSLDGGECAAFTASLGGDADTAVAAELLSLVIEQCVHGGDFPGISMFSSAADGMLDWCRSHEPVLFAAGFNPVTAIHSAQEISQLFRSLEGCASLTAGEEIIVNAVNRRVKTPVTRATVDHPFAVLPFAVLLAQLNRGLPLQALFRAAEEGGESAALCSLVGALLCSENDPLEAFAAVFTSLVGRRELQPLAERIAAGTASPKEIAPYLSAELSLTSKENEEREARMKHGKVSAPPRKKDRREQERSLTKHVVESWTKADKARWKKERRRMEGEMEE